MIEKGGRFNKSVPFCCPFVGRGVFSYDVCNDGGYKLVAKPVVPLQLSDLPSQVKHCIFQSSMQALSIVSPLDIELRHNPANGTIDA